MAKASIPNVDLSPFFSEGDEESRTKAKEIINHACSEYGFFQVVNHGVPLSLMTHALELSKTFFEYPREEKQKFSSVPGAPQLTGYIGLSETSESFLIRSPGSTLNIYPADLQELREVVEELFSHFSKTGLLVKKIMSECLDLPSDYFDECNHAQGSDLMVAHGYFPAADNKNKIALTEHQDADFLTFVLQDDVGGLEILKEEEWVPVVPTDGSLVVNIGDVIQVLSNNKYKSAKHRVVSQQGKNRYSYAFFCNVDGDKWVEPLPKFTTEIGEPAKYRGFFFKEYHQQRFRNITHPPSKPEDRINITHYVIPNN